MKTRCLLHLQTMLMINQSKKTAIFLKWSKARPKLLLVTKT